MIVLRIKEEYSKGSKLCIEYETAAFSIRTKNLNLIVLEIDKEYSLRSNQLCLLTQTSGFPLKLVIKLVRQHKTAFFGLKYLIFHFPFSCLFI